MFYKRNDIVYRQLASGIDESFGKFRNVVIYCPDDNEHTIYVMGTDEFNKKFEIVKGE